MTEKNILKSSLEVFPFVVQVDENSSGKNINSTNNIIVVKDDNLIGKLSTRFAAIKNGECLEVTIPEGMEEKAFLSKNAIKIIKLVSELRCSKLRIISAKKDVNDHIRNDILGKKLQRLEFKESKVKKGSKGSKTNKWNKKREAKLESEKTKGNKVGKKFDVKAQDQQSTINNIKSEDTDIEPADDSVFHIAEAIIAHAAKLDDKELRSNEKEFTADEIESKLRSFVGSAKLMFKNTPLGSLNILKVKSTALKRVHTKVLATVCTNAFNEIKGSKDIKKCVNDLSNALIRYSKSEKFEDCKKIILIQEKLRKAIKNYKHIESVNEVLNTVFIRAAVDKFYKKFEDLSNPNVLHNVKFTFNSLYEKIFDVPAKEKSLAINLLNTHLKNLIYGFGFYPSSVDIELKNLSGKNVKTTKVLSALGALSKEHALTIKNGKKFEVVDTGSLSDRNCAFRAISIGAGFGPNGYNIVQQKVVEGAQKLLKMWDGLDHGLQMQITEMLIENVDTSDDKEYTPSDVKKLLQEYINCRGEGFVAGVQNIEYLFAAIGLGRPICKIDAETNMELTFLPDGRSEYKIRDNYFVDGKRCDPIYVGRISGHTEALLPLDNKGSRKIADKLPELDKKVSDMKDAISKHISGVIYEAINKQSSLLKIIARDPRHIGESFIEAFLKNPRCKNDKNLFVAMKILAEVGSKLDADKKAEAYNLEKEIRIIAKNKASGKLSPSQEEVLQNKLKQFVDIFADKAVELCKEEPLFWDNVRNSILRLW